MAEFYCITAAAAGVDRMTGNRESMITPQAVTGLLLAGGGSRRMGGEDKGLLELAGRPLALWVLERLTTQVATVLISANRNTASYAAFGAEVITDRYRGFAGPLAGFATGLARARTPWLATVPCDSPFLPRDLVARLCTAATASQVDAVVAHDGERLQPVFSLLSRDVRADLDSFLAAGERKIDLWLERLRWQAVDFSDQQEMFANVNTPADLAAASALLAKRP